MADRYTRKDAERAFDRLATALGKPHSAHGGGSWHSTEPVSLEIVATPGWWELDYAACYGGYVIHEVANEGGGVRCPMGDERRTAREFVSAVRFALDTIRASDVTA